MSVTAPGRKIVAMTSDEQQVATGEAEPGEAVRDERAREDRPEVPMSAIAIVLKSSRGKSIWFQTST